MAERFEAKVEPRGGSTFFTVPPGVVAALGPKKRVPVRVTVNDHTFRTTVAPMGGEFLLPFNRQNRTAAGLAAGDVVDVLIERDDEPRVVTVPDDLAAALAGDAAAGERFERLSYSHQREYVEWIEEAKRPETRTRRVAQTVERVKDGRTAR